MQVLMPGTNYAATFPKIERWMPDGAALDEVNNQMKKLPGRVSYYRRNDIFSSSYRRNDTPACFGEEELRPATLFVSGERNRPDNSRPKRDGDGQRSAVT